MEYTKEFMESLPTPKYKYNQDVLVVRDGEIEVSQITGVYIDAVEKDVKYTFNCGNGLVREHHIFGTPQEMADAILTVFGYDKYNHLNGDWRCMKN